MVFNGQTQALATTSPAKPNIGPVKGRPDGEAINGAIDCGEECVRLYLVRPPWDESHLQTPARPLEGADAFGEGLTRPLITVLFP